MKDGYPSNYLPKNIRYKSSPTFISKNNTPKQAINQVVNSAAVGVKLFYERGFGRKKSLPIFDLPMAKKLVMLAHQHHLPVLMHANALYSQHFAIDSGVDIIAHGMWHWGEYDHYQQGMPDPIKKQLDRIIMKNIGYQPTLQVVNGQIALSNKNFLKDAQLVKVYPQHLIDWFSSQAGQWYEPKKVPLGRTLQQFRSSLISYQQQVCLVLQYLHMHHAQLLFGTDTPSDPIYTNPPGYNGYMEMQQWVKAGVSLKEILLAATIRNAKYLRLQNKYGSISPGKIANLLLLKKNPLKTIKAYDSITQVMLNGKLYPRKKFIAN
jgi:hypothetical protein